MQNCQFISTADLEELLSLWVDAEKAVTSGQNYSVEGLSVSRVDAQLIVSRQNEIRRELCERAQKLQGNGRAGVMTPKW